MRERGQKIKINSSTDLAVHPRKVLAFLEEKGRATMTDLMVEFEINNHQAHDLIAILFLGYKVKPSVVKGFQKYPMIVWSIQKAKPKRQGAKGAMNKAARRKERQNSSAVAKVIGKQPVKVDFRRDE